MCTVLASSMLGIYLGLAAQALGTYSFSSISLAKPEVPGIIADRAWHCHCLGADTQGMVWKSYLRLFVST